MTRYDLIKLYGSEEALNAAQEKDQEIWERNEEKSKYTSVKDIPKETGKFGYWTDEEFFPDGWTARCTNCNRTVEASHAPSIAYKWCPYCGANMTWRNK